MDNESAEGVAVVFLISLPRSGSTALQRMLALSPEVYTVAEPWICLPLAAMCDPTLVAAEYWHRTCYQALEDLIAELPAEETTYLHLIEQFVTRIYSAIAEGSNATTFVDKTPRYYLIIPFLAKAFPNAKFILLFRNPLEVLSSILRTWGNNRIRPRLRSHYVDLLHGPRLMADGARLLRDRALCLDYSRLVSQPDSVIRETCVYLGIEYSETMVSEYHSVSFRGRMGDPFRADSYESISKDSLGTRRLELNNFYIKYLCRRYVRFLGDHTLSPFGLTVDSLLTDLDEIPTVWKGALSDALGHGCINVWRWINYLSTGPRGFRRARRRPYVPYG